MYELNAVKRSPITNDGKLAGFIGEFREPLGMDDRVYIGIDPGQVNMGLAVIGFNGFIAWQMKVDNVFSLQERVMEVMNLVDRVLGWSIADTELANKRPGRGCIEQAAYSKLYGQPALAEARTAACVSLMRWGMPYIDSPVPGTIRATVFGNKKISAEVVWKDWLGAKMGNAVHYDSASALACAVYAIRKEQANANGT